MTILFALIAAIFLVRQIRKFTIVKENNKSLLSDNYQRVTDQEQDEKA